MLAGIREVLIISTPRRLRPLRAPARRRQRMGHAASNMPCSRSPRAGAGLHHRPRVRRQRTSALILGDNIFYGAGFADDAAAGQRAQPGATVFAYPSRIRSAMASSSSIANGTRLSIEEKPQQPKSHWAVTGSISTTIRCSTSPPTLKPSPRGELEITDVNRVYLERQQLRVRALRPRLRLARHGDASNR